MVELGGDGDSHGSLTGCSESRPVIRLYTILFLMSAKSQKQDSRSIIDMVLRPNDNGHTLVWLSRRSGLGHADLQNPTRSSAVSDAMAARSMLQILPVPPYGLMHCMTRMCRRCVSPPQSVSKLGRSKQGRS